MELETRRKSGRRCLNGGPYRAVTFVRGFRLFVDLLLTWTAGMRKPRC